MVQPERVVVVGGGLAGLRTAERLRRSGYDGALTLVGAETHLPYDRPPLSKTLLTQEDTPVEPVPLRPATAYDELRLDLRTGVTATGLDIAARQVALDTGESLPYDRLVVATGVRARRIEAFTARPGVLTLRTFDDCLALRRSLRAARHLTVVGAGVLGCEVAAAARALGLEVTVVESLEQPLTRVLGSEVGGVLAAKHRDEGVKLHCSTQVLGLEGNGRVERVVLDDGAVVSTDLVVLAVGSIPNTDWLEGSGLEVADGVVCDRTGTTCSPDVLAAGDVARMPHPSGEGTVRLEHWTSAGDTAAAVARNVLAAPDERVPLTEVPYFWSDQYDLKLQCLGVAAPDDDLNVVAGSLESGRFLGLYARDGRVTGAVTIGMPAALARCRTAVGARASLADLIAAAPWDRARAATA